MKNGSAIAETARLVPLPIVGATNRPLWVTLSSGIFVRDNF